MTSSISIIYANLCWWRQQFSEYPLYHGTCTTVWPSAQLLQVIDDLSRIHRWNDSRCEASFKRRFCASTLRAASILVMFVLLTSSYTQVYILYEVWVIRNTVYFVRILKYTSYTYLRYTKHRIFCAYTQVFILYEVWGIRNTVYFVRILKYSSYTNVWGCLLYTSDAADE